MFYIIYFGLIGKRCFIPRWRCVSYMETAPLAPLAPPPSNKQLEATLHFRHSSNFHPIFILKHLIVNQPLSLCALSEYSEINVRNVLSLICDDVQEVFALHKC